MSLWQQCVHTLEQQFKEEEIHTWIQPIQSSEDDNGLSLTAPNSSIASWFIQNCFIKTQTFLNSISDKHIPLSLRIATPSPAHPTSPEAFNLPKNQTDMPISQVQSATDNDTQKILDSGLNFAQTFDNFVVGKSNRLAYGIAKQVAQLDGGEYNPFFLYSGVGLGKTHLLNAIGNYVLQQKPQSSVLYLSSERFVKDLIHALRGKLMDKFKTFYRNFDVLLIDDIQFIAGKDHSQEEFFHTYNSLLHRNTKLVMTCDRYHGEINHLDERLKSRFAAGVAQIIDLPDTQTRTEIVLSKAQQLDLEIPQEVAEFVAENIHSNVRELEGAVRRIYATANVLQCPVSKELAEEALSDALSYSKALSIHEIQQVVARFYKTSVDDLLSKSRRQSVTHPRHVAMALCKEMTSHSLPTIGEAFGGRDHTTVLHACRKMKAAREKDATLNSIFCRLKHEISH